MRATLFDFDGTLANTEGLHFASFQAVLEPLGLGYSWEEHEATYMPYASEDVFRLRLGELTDARMRELCHAKNLAYLEKLEALEIPPFPGAVEAIRFAKSQGKIAICTGAVRSDVLPLLENFGVLDLFDAIVTADDVSRSKPDPASYALAAKEVGEEPRHCLAVEDTVGGLMSARGAGCACLAVAQTQPAERLSEYADLVLPDIRGFEEAWAHFSGS